MANGTRSEAREEMATVFRQWGQLLADSLEEMASDIQRGNADLTELARNLSNSSLGFGAWVQETLKLFSENPHVFSDVPSTPGGSSGTPLQ